MPWLPTQQSIVVSEVWPWKHWCLNPTSNLPNLCKQVFSMPCSFHHQQASKEKYIHQVCALLLHQAVIQPPLLMPHCGNGRNPAQTAGQFILVQFQWKVWEYSQPIKLLHPHPSMHFHGNNTYRWVENLGAFFCNLTILSSFEDKLWIQLCTLCTLRYSQSISFVSFVGVWMLTDFIPFHSGIFFEWELKKSGVWSMLIIYFGSWFCSLTFRQICCMTCNASAAKKTEDLLVSWVPIWYFKAWLLCHLKMIFAFALSDFTQKSWHKSDALQDTIQEVAIILCSCSSKTY